MKPRSSEIIAIVAAAIGAALYTDDWINGASVLVLWFGVRILSTGDGFAILALAFSYEWMQVAIGPFYMALTGQQLRTAIESDYRPMLLLGLGCVTALAVGLRLGVYLVRRTKEPTGFRRERIASFRTLLAAYVISAMVELPLMSIAQEYPSLRQVLITLTTVHLGLLFLVVRRLVVPKLRWSPLAVILAAEVARGFTFYYAGFREPLVMAAVVLLEVFDRRRFAHWATAAAVAVVGIVAAVLWMGVRGTYRAELDVGAFGGSEFARFDRISTLGAGFLQGRSGDFEQSMDALVDRMWALHYPALALARVPQVVPHTDGALLWTAIQHVFTPRIIFPDKPDLLSDSETVRRYAGVYVAGPEQNTSIAFGYAGESYVDFGVPWMFAPILGFGILMGLAYAWLIRHIWHRELMIAVVNVTFWLVLYVYERSWPNMLGMGLSVLVYLDIPILVFDWALLQRHQPAPDTDPLAHAAGHYR